MWQSAFDSSKHVVQKLRGDIYETPWVYFEMARDFKNDSKEIWRFIAHPKSIAIYSKRIVCSTRSSSKLIEAMDEFLFRGAVKSGDSNYISGK